MRPLPATTALDAFILSPPLRPPGPVGTLAEAPVHKGPRVKPALRATYVDGRFSHLCTETTVLVALIVAHYGAGGASERKRAALPASFFRRSLYPEPEWGGGGRSRGRSPPRALGSREQAESPALPLASSFIRAA